jgi:3-dehydroquinate synthase
MKVQSYVGEYTTQSYSDFSFIREIKELEHKYFVIDKKVYGIYEEQLKPLIDGEQYYLVDAIEENKNVDTALAIIGEMLELASKRNTVLVAIGGGIVQDISAFISNIIYRGIKWVLIPTTLLAQADSCIGSKSSMNFKHYKNILGYFYPPTKIYINTGFVCTLEQKDYFSGLGEIMKCAIMAGYDSFKRTEGHLDAILDYDEHILHEEINKALNFKKSVIEKDEFDKGYRNIMNFGHTFGHALESTSDYAVPHGQGVSFGIIIANEISCKRGYISTQTKDELNQAVWRIVTPSLLRREYFEGEKYIQTLRKDKKYTGGKHTCILFYGDGVRKYSDVGDEEILAAIENVFKNKKL